MTLLLIAVFVFVVAAPAFGQDAAPPASTDTSGAASATTTDAGVAVQVAAPPATEVGDAKASLKKVVLKPKPKAKRKGKRHRAKAKTAAPAGKITICHATGSATNPFVTININSNGLEGHGDHANDIIPAPAGGCPTGVTPPPPPGKITICHATGSATNPFVEITVSVNGLEGHGDHPNDIIPAPSTGCPGAPPPPPPPPGSINICHANGSPPTSFTLVVVPDTGDLGGHVGHVNDIIPAPASGCPTVATPSTPGAPGSTPGVTTTPTPTEEAPSTPTEEPAAEEPAAKKKAPTAEPAAEKVTEELPFTGMSSGIVAGLGALLLLLGFGLRRMTDRRLEPDRGRGLDGL